MLIEYLHDAPNGTHQGPSGAVYEFLPDAEGRRVAEVTDQGDIERFLSIANQWGVPQFRALPKPRRTRG